MKYKKNEKGFTLIELLAVIVILGLLMAIAIPSVTKYITQSRVKTLVSTVDSYVRSVSNQVNDGDYKFSDGTKIYAIPIECVSLEKGGTDPFGNWHQANDNYWAYVLVHYDSKNYNYEYGFTFKDDAGYGLYPTKSDKITNSMIRTGYDDLKQPKDGLAVNFVPIEKWEGFTGISSSTELAVLEAESDGFEGDTIDTCTLYQKGDNYEDIEEEKLTRPQPLAKLIKKYNSLIMSKPTLTTSSNNSNDQSGLYKSTATNSGNSTYYFRGNVKNNYVSFADHTWRVIRINEDNSIRIILNYDAGLGNNAFNKESYNVTNMYYSNSNILKPLVENWYSSNVKEKGYDSYVIYGSFCEQAKVKYSSSYTSGNAEMKVYTEYMPNFKCSTDGNGKGPLNIKVGLITYDEAIYAGGYVDIINDYYFLTKKGWFWTMSPNGFANQHPNARVWYIYSKGEVSMNGVNHGSYVGLRPVINLNANILATGTGTSSDPYVVQTN